MDKSKFIWILVLILLFFLVITWRSGEDTRQQMKEEYGPKIKYAEFWEDEGVPRIEKIINSALEKAEYYDPEDLYSLVDSIFSDITYVISDAPLPY